DVLPSRHQHLEITLDGGSVWAGAVRETHLAVRVPVPASAGARRIGLHWAQVGSPGPDDDREVAGILRFLGIGTGPPPAAVRVPADLDDPTLNQGGIYSDGWISADSWVELAGGDSVDLVLRAFVPGDIDEHVHVIVNGAVTASTTVA